ncbi:hypothetical protein SEPCBS119000_000361 [Sporothrix epigloea]|uniref:Uncharacterized protein n=1 Tax=Sporothrix epigloea TaxID=1892477 RepID=A0ABP0D4P1_9PEZI
MPQYPANTEWVILRSRRDWRHWYDCVKCVAARDWKYFSPENDHVPGPSLVAPERPVLEEYHQPFEYDEHMKEAELDEAVRQYQLENDTRYRNTRLRYQEYSYEYQDYRIFADADQRLSEHITATVSIHIRSKISAFGSAAERLAYLYKHYKEDRGEARRDATKNYEDIKQDFSLTESWILRWEETVDDCMRLGLIEIVEGCWLEDLGLLLSPLDRLVAFEAYHEFKKGGETHKPENVIKWANKLRRVEHRASQGVNNGIVQPYAPAPDDSDDVSQARRKRARSQTTTGEQQPSRRPHRARYGQEPLCKACNQAVHQIDRCWAVFPHKAPSTVSSSDLNTLKLRLEAAAAQDPVLRMEVNRARDREANR